jgi:7-carboxy-7-deazaguanine synthase
MSMTQQSTTPTSRDRGLPIAETFHSIQGEGTYVGTPMHFIRLSGCPVGKKATEVYVRNVEEVGRAKGIEIKAISPLPIYPSMCQTWDGRFFPCDTDFSCHTYKTVDELIGETWEKHICLTGGEPLIHQKSLIEQGFFQQAFQKGIQIHIETSSTVMLHPDLQHDKRIWISTAPKFGYIEEMLMLADEVKILVDETFTAIQAAEVLQWVREKNNPQQIFLSPINDEKEVNFKNVQRCLEILWDHPTWRLSCQWHKLLNLR